jgi:von Willebrand factor type A domain.
MTWGKLITGGLVLALVAGSGGARAQEQTPPVAAFKSSIDMVRIAAVVRDSKGRFVRDLTARDFEVLDSGRSTTHQRSPERPGGRQRRHSVRRQRQHGRSLAVRARGGHPRAQLARGLSDEAAVYTFDTHLDERAPFTTGLHTLPDSMTSVVPFGATSLHDAIAQTARRVGEREGRRRAVVVLTDGNDNSSRLKPADVSAIASAIDVPVYIFGIVPSIDNPTAENSTHSVESAAFAGPLADSPPGPAGTFSWRARRRSAASRRGKSSTSFGISI